MKHPYANTYKILFGTILFGLIILGVLSYKNNSTHKETSKLIINSHQVLVQAEHLSSIISMLEVNRRGYVLTSDSAFVSDFLKYRSIILQHADSLERLTNGNAVQSASIGKLN